MSELQGYYQEIPITIQAGQTESSVDIHLNGQVIFAVTSPTLVSATSAYFKAKVGETGHDTVRPDSGANAEFAIVSNKTTLFGGDFYGINQAKIVIDASEASDVEFIIHTRRIV